MRFRIDRGVWLVAQALACLSLAACGGADSDPNALDTGELDQAARLRWRQIDGVAPTVEVTTSGTLSGTTLTGLAGNAGDNMRIYRVRWSNDRGGSGSASLSRDSER